ncbi:hypothetical protein ACE6H2_002485 [Prunus campanulata]
MGPNLVELINLLPFRNPDDDDDDDEEGVGVLQRDDYVDGPSELSLLIMDKGWETTLNRLKKLSWNDFFKRKVPMDSEFNPGSSSVSAYGSSSSSGQL